MTDTATILLALAAVAAAGDWIAVARRTKPLEYLCKPLATAALLGVALAVEPTSDARRIAFAVALGLSLAGDVFLMLPRDAFVAGLGSFLLAHIAYIVGFRIDDPATGIELIVPTVGVLLVVAAVGVPIMRAVRSDHPALAVPVAGYIAVIAVMVASALATRNVVAGAGAIVFMASDTLIAWNRFVRPLAWAPVAIMVTYHAGQTGLVLSLLR